MKASARFSARLDERSRSRSSTTGWWLGVALGTVLEVVTEGMFGLRAAVVVVDKKSGEEVIRHLWSDGAVATRDLEMIQAQLDSMTVDEFNTEWSLRSPTDQANG